MANLFSEKPIVKVVMLKGQDGEEKLINQADGSGLSFWVGTKAEYEAIPETELINNCIYYITDATTGDFNTRLNQLDTAVDNNTTAIAENAGKIADNATAIAENAENIAALNAVTYVQAIKTLDGTGDENRDRIISDDYFSEYTIKANKFGNTVSIYADLTLNSSGVSALAGGLTLFTINSLFDIESTTGFVPILSRVHAPLVFAYADNTSIVGVVRQHASHINARTDSTLTVGDIIEFSLYYSVS